MHILLGYVFFFLILNTYKTIIALKMYISYFNSVPFLDINLIIEE